MPALYYSTAVLENTITYSHNLSCECKTKLYLEQTDLDRDSPILLFPFVHQYQRVSELNKLLVPEIFTFT